MGDQTKQNGVINHKIDHIAVAVTNLETAIEFYRDTLGFILDERRDTKGKTTGMISAVMRAGEFSIVLVQGTEPESQVSKYVQYYGPGVQHIAFRVEDIEDAREQLHNSGMKFSTNIIHGPGLKQIFSVRDKASGMMYEFIERGENSGFHDQNVQSLFEQLEASNQY